MENKKSYFRDSNIWFAWILIGAGGLLILDNMDFIFFDVWELWPMVFILIGLNKMKASRHAERSSAWLFLALGSLFLLSNIGLFDLGWIWTFWPLLLIFAGIAVLTQHKRIGSSSSMDSMRASENRINALSVFAGHDRVITSNNFEGGAVTALFGGAKLDFRDASLAPGDHNIETLAMFGGVELIVPSNWTVIVSCTPIFGGLEDKRRNRRETETSVNSKLFVRGIVLFGGLEIKDG